MTPAGMTPIPALPRRISARYRATRLGAEPVVVAKGGPSPRTTAYVRDTLLVRGGWPSVAEGVGLLAQVGETLGFTVEPSQTYPESSCASEEFTPAGLRMLEKVWTTRVRLVPGDASTNVDAWWILQTLRQAGLGEDFSLEHLMFAACLSGYPHMRTGVSAVHGREAADLRVRPEMVSLPLAGALMRVERDVCAPNVVVCDSGFGGHPWFDGVDCAVPTVAGVRLGHPGPLCPANGRVVDLTGNPSPFAGHGTFVAGLVRQACPGARLTSVPVLDDDGVTLESSVVNALALLLARHISGRERGDARPCVSVVCVTSGFYHEQPDREDFAGPLSAVVHALGEWGVSVVASAGNQASHERWFPAALAARSDMPVPVVSVGALDASGGDAAWFSNTGTWVRAYRPGVNVVSSIDGDGGRFAMWSGTSFAAPQVAGELAAALGGCEIQCDETRLTAIERAQQAQRDVVGCC